jgi:hypothetical protein
MSPAREGVDVIEDVVVDTNPPPRTHRASMVYDVRYRLPCTVGDIRQRSGRLPLGSPARVGK